ncbi:hypothetical protein FA15DRAFT_703678 [Coprinopsis marcescibilis]|uniref:Protein SMG7 n=1 Tax=Coprinopsis marcescibilis TaxID=230819 RepID=A0A5C3KXN8_COPMA|nr:hypothetical protein FA15DRAFT_703678 [Coprinopsis marcescibilis]
MTEQPAAIAREAKKIYQSLKELLKTKEPFDKELEFQRKNLRKRYLTLLLLHPYENESKDVENHLWMQTSYASISSYKERIAIIDRALSNRTGQTHQNSRHTTHGPVEHRKLLTRFRQFLAEEERFWIQLVLRMYRSFGLVEAQPALTTLGIIVDNQDATEDTRDGARNSFPEEPEAPLEPSNNVERESRLAILSKALICLGDIARYREYYNEAATRARAGQEVRRGKPKPPHVVLYTKAQQRYEQARLLVPHDGNPFHQLAILSTYRKDTFSSVLYYYRALCVRQPYETAADNMATVLHKGLDQWKRSKRDRDRMLAAGPLEVKDRISLFKDRVVVLHALWRKGIEKQDSKSREHDKTVYQDFRELVSERLLPPDTICNVLIMSQGGLWKHRMLRDTPISGRRQEGQGQISPEAPSAGAEWRILRHLMDMHYALLDVGREELKDVASADKATGDLAQRISAVFRRTLNALRIASKWLRANFNYVMGDLEFQAYQEKERFRSVTIAKKFPHKISAYSVHTIRFWKGYAQFVGALSQEFPADKLPSLTISLEEDIDVKGFLCLKKMMGESPKGSTDVTAGAGQTGEGAHPNEEHLMRISDLLADARALVSLENSPLVLVNDIISFNEQVVEPRNVTLSETRKATDGVPARQQQIMDHIRDKSIQNRRKDREDDVMTEVTSRTDDDVLKAAFEHIDKRVEEDDEEDDGEDEIVWNPKPLSPTSLSPLAQATPITPLKFLAASISSANTLSSPPQAKHSPLLGKTPINSPRAAHASATTAQDLLHDVMNAGRKPSASLVPPSDPSGIQPALLFGSELFHRPTTHSIWSAGVDEQPLRFGVSTSPNHNHAFQTSPRMYSQGIGNSGINGSQDLDSGTWSSQATTQASQPMGGVLPSVHPLQQGIGNLHTQVPSTSAPHHLSSYQGNLAYEQNFLHSSPSMSMGLATAPQTQMYSMAAAYYQQLSANGNTLQDTFAPARMGYHSQHPSISLQDNRFGNGQYNSPISSIWGNVG